MLVTKYIEIDMGHRVTNHKSKCASLHGHRYRIEAGVDDKVITEKGISDEGMVIDFGDLKSIMMSEIDAIYDHGIVLWKGDSLCDSIKKDAATKYTEVDFIPTAENLAKHWFKLIQKPLQDRGIKLKFVCVYETPTSTATYEE